MDNLAHLRSASPEQLAICDLARALFGKLVALPTHPATQPGVKGPDGQVVGFCSMVAECQLDEVSQGVLKVAGYVNKYAQELGAVGLHVLTPCSVTPIYDTRAMVYWDGLFELPNGELDVP